MKNLTYKDCVFISGPMTGIKDYNRAAFFEADKLLKPAMCQVMNPASLPPDQTYEWYMRQCLAMMTKCTAILQLPGWDKSKGAKLEKQIADALKLRVVEI